MIVEIGGHRLGDEEPCFVIAEVGINHNGSLEMAKRLIDAAKEARCDAVKFQKRTIELCYTPDELSKPRSVPVSSGVLQMAVKRGVLPDDSVSRLISSDFENSTNGDLKYALEFTQSEYDEIDNYCREIGMMWFASPWDEPAVEFLERYDPPCYKIASARARGHDSFLEHVHSTGRPVILSTGGCEFGEVRHAVEILGEEDLVIMHCVLAYPAPEGSLNLRMIQTYQNYFSGVPIGYSGHEVGLPPTVMAAVLGASTVERHITLDRSMFGSDQSASVEPGGFKTLVRDIRIWERERGNGVKSVLQSEHDNYEKLRRKIVPA